MEIRIVGYHVRPGGVHLRSAFLWDSAVTDTESDLRVDLFLGFAGSSAPIHRNAIESHDVWMFAQEISVMICKHLQLLKTLRQRAVIIVRQKWTWGENLIPS